MFMKKISVLHYQHSTKLTVNFSINIMCVNIYIETCRFICKSAKVIYFLSFPNRLPILTLTVHITFHESEHEINSKRKHRLEKYFCVMLC